MGSGKDVNYCVSFFIVFFKLKRFFDTKDVLIDEDWEEMNWRVASVIQKSLVKNISVNVHGILIAK